eukprot:21730_1
MFVEQYYLFFSSDSVSGVSHSTCEQNQVGSKPCVSQAPEQAKPGVSQASHESSDNAWHFHAEPDKMCSGLRSRTIRHQLSRYVQPSCHSLLLGNQSILESECDIISGEHLSSDSASCSTKSN